MLGIKVRALQEVEFNSTSYESYYRQARDILGEVPYMPVPIKSPFAGTPEPFAGNLEKSIERLPHTIEPLQETLTIPVWRNPICFSKQHPHVMTAIASRTMLCLRLSSNVPLAWD